MKRILLLLSVVSFLSCQNNGKISSPEDLGKRAFDVLKNIKEYSYEEYSSVLYSADSLVKIIMNEKEISELPLTNFQREKVIQSGLSDINKSRLKSYNDLKLEGLKNNIEWKKIEFVDFIVDEDYKAINDSEGNEEILIGDAKLYFKSNNSTFVVSTGYIEHKQNNQFYLVILENIKEFKNHN